MTHDIIYPPSFKGKTFSAYVIDRETRESSLGDRYETRLNDSQRKALAAQIFKT